MTNVSIITSLPATMLGLIETNHNSIWLTKNQGQYVTDAKFVGVDLLEGTIESQCIAVFKSAPITAE